MSERSDSKCTGAETQRQERAWHVQDTTEGSHGWFTVSKGGEVGDKV